MRQNASEQDRRSGHLIEERCQPRPLEQCWEKLSTRTVMLRNVRRASGSVTLASGALQIGLLLLLSSRSKVK